MAHAKIAKRLLAMLLCVIMVASMLPVSALAALLPVSRAAGDPDYTVRFVKDPFTTQTVQVYTVVGTGNSNPLKIPNATLDNVSLQIGEESMDVNGLTAGYGLLNVEVGDTRYYLTGATWGPSGDAIATFNYDTVTTNAAKGIYLHYQAAGNQTIPATPWDSDTNSKITSDVTTIPAGNIDETVAAGLVKNGAWYFDRAELRSKTGNKVVPITSIQQENGYYYVQTDVSEQTLVAFSPNAWDVYLVYEPARTLTINLTRSDGAGDLNMIDGTGIKVLAPGDEDTVTGHVYIQTPVNQAREVLFTVGSGGNLKLTNSSNTVLFDNAVDGYQYKSYTYTFEGTQNVTLNASFVGTPQKYLDYTHYFKQSDSYHSMTIFKNDAIISNSGSATDAKTQIQNNDIISFAFGVNSGIDFVPNVLVLNGTSVEIPWPGTDYSIDPPAGNQNISWSKTTPIVDDAGNIQAKATVTMTLVGVGSNGQIALQSRLNVKLTEISNNLKIGFYNNARADQNTEVRITGVGESTLWTKLNTGAYTTFPVGQGFNVNNASNKRTFYADVTWDNYILGMYLRTPGTNGNWTEDQLATCVVSDPPSGGDNANTTTWYGDKAWYFDSSSANQSKIRGLQQAVIRTSPVNFRYVYCLPLPNNTSQYAEIADSNTFIFADGAENTWTDTGGFEYEGKIFLGWSLNKNGSGTVTQPGQPVLRDVVDKAYKQNKSVVQYGETAQATIRLYPVFADTNNIEYASYTVAIHTDGDSYYTATGIAGSMVDRESVLALPEVASRLEALGEDWVLDGARSDSMLTLDTTTKTFHLYYNSTANVDIKFVSAHGFDPQAGTESSGVWTVTGSYIPGTAFNEVDIPTPKSEGVPATFVGWNTDKDASVGTPTETLQKTVVPSQNTTYYAIYAPDIELTFHTWSPDGSWAKDGQTITVKSGQSIGADNDNTSKVQGWEKSYQGYTFSHWAQNGPYGTNTYTSDQIQTLTDFTGGTTFYAVYTPESNVTVKFDANGGAFADDAITGSGSLDSEKKLLTMSDQTVGQVLTPPTPTREGSYVFVGWSEKKDDTTGSMAVTVQPGEHTYYALWLPTSLTVEVTGEAQTYDGGEKKPSVKVTWNGSEVSPDNYDVVYADNVNAGTARVTVTGTKGAIQNLTGFTTFKISQRDISNATIEGVKDAYDYSGSTIVPEKVTVTDSGLNVADGSKTLELGKDYTLSYGANTNVGDAAYVEAVGHGNYTGSLKQEFNIQVDRDVQLSIAPIADYVVRYEGSTAAKPTGLTADNVLVYDSNRRLLKSDEYTINWPQSWEIGEKTLSVTGTGNYAGKQAEVKFNITAQSVTLTVSVTPARMEVGQGNPQITVMAGSTNLTDLSEKPYTLTYKKYEGQSWVDCDEADLQTAGMYRVTATGKQGTLYQGATGSHVFVRNQRTASVGDYVLSLTNGSTAFTYDGTDHNDLGNGNKLLDADNFTVKQVGAEGDTDVNATVTVQTITRDGTEIYNSTGSPSSYEIKNAGVYVVTVKVEEDGGQSTDTTGTLTIYVSPKSINSDNITFAPKNTEDDSNMYIVEEGNTRFAKYYTGEPQNHEFTLTDTGISSSEELTGDEEKAASGGAPWTPKVDADYYVGLHDHNDHYNVGDYPVVVVGTGNYTGTRTLTFSIRPKVITVGTENNDIQLTYGYTQEEATQALAKLQEDVNKEIVARDRLSGEATNEPDPAKISIKLYVDDVLNAGNDQNHVHATLSGTSAGNYQLTQADIKAKVDVKPKPLTDAEITATISPATDAFNGDAHTPTVTVTHNRGGSAWRVLNSGTEYKLSYKYLGLDGSSSEDVNEIREVGKYKVVITATADGNYTGSREVDFEVTAPTQESGSFLVTLDNTSVEYDGTQKKPGVNVYFNSNKLTETDYEVTYSNNTNAGTATVTVEGKGTYASLSATKTFTITRKSLNSSGITVEMKDTETYTGNPITPAITVKDGDKVLQLNKDYTVRYQRNGVDAVMQDAASYNVVIEGMGNYKDPLTKSFTIEAADMSGSGGQPGAGFTVRAYPSTGTFDGSTHVGRFDLVVTYNGKVLGENDYSVSYLDPNQLGTSVIRDPGLYTIQVNGKGNYKGTATTTYEVLSYQSGENALKINLTGADNLVYNGEAHTPTISVTFGTDDTELKKGTGAEDSNADYYVEYQHNTDAGQATVIVRGINSYAGYSAVASFTIGQRDIKDATVDEITAQPYTGTQITPTVTVKDTEVNSGAELKLYKDYTVTYSDNVEVVESKNDEGSVTIHGTGNYKGSKTVNFDIQAASISGGGSTDPAEGFTVDIYPPAMPYTGTEQTPTVIVHHGGQLLTEGEDKDYTVSYEKDTGTLGDNGEPKEVGTYKVVVTGKGNYQGEVKKNFEITTADGAVLVIGGLDTAVYTGGDRTPSLTVTPYQNGSAAGSALDSGTYSAVWSGDLTEGKPVNAGVYYVTVTVNSGSYAGHTATAAYVISPKDLGEADGTHGNVSVSVVADDLTYDGTAKEPKVTTKYTPSSGSANTLTEDDYILVYANNINAGEDATVTVYGRGNYTGSKTEKFTIAKSGTEGGGSGGGDTAGFTVSVHPSQDVYTGVKHNPYVQVVDKNTNRILSADEYTLDWDDKGLTEAKTYKVTVTAAENSNYLGSASAQYTITQPTAGSGALRVNVTAGQNFEYDGTAKKPTITVTYGAGNETVDSQFYKVTYTDSENKAVTEDKLIDAGTYTITVTGTGGNYNALTGTATFTIAQRDINNATVKPIDDQRFSGTQLKPEVTVTDAVPTADTKLVATKDYTLSYGANNTAGTGTGSVTISGTGNYMGSMTVYFDILSAGGGDPSDPTQPPATGEIVIVTDIADQTYTGEQIQPDVTVQWNGKDGTVLTLTPDQDYKLSYGENKEIGRGSVTATGIGNYEGLTAQKFFNIVASLLHLDVTVNPAQAAINGGDPTIKVELNGTDLTDVENAYKLTYQKYENSAWGAATDLTLTADNKADGLDAEGVYLITATGTGAYAGAKGTATFVRYKLDMGDITPTIPEAGEGDDQLGADVTVEGSLITTTYNGENRIGLLKNITVNGTGGGSLVEGTDYQISVSYNGGTAVNLDANEHNKYQMVNAGLYTVSYEPLENSGTTGKSTTIAIIVQPKSINGVSVTGLENKTYTGAEQSATPTVADPNIKGTTYTLKKDTDYILVGDTKGTNAGKYQVVIQGQGNYTGSVVKDFVIDPAKLTITGDSITITYGDPFTITEGERVTADSETGTYTFTVSGRMPTGDVTKDDVTVTLTAPTVVAGSPHNFTATLGGDKAANYTVTQPTFTLTVNPMSMVTPPGGGSGGEGDSDGDGVKDPDKDTDNDGSIEDGNGDGTIVTTGGFTVTVSPTSKPYTGQPLAPEVTVTYQPKDGDIQTLKTGTDYTVTYYAGENAGSGAQQIASMIEEGKYTVRVTGNGNYKGSFDFGFEITKNPDDDKDTDGDGYIEDGGDGSVTTGAYKVWLSSTSGYHNGQAHTPKVNVTFNGSALQEDTHFNVQYLGSDGNSVANMVEVGSYTVRVTGEGEHNSLKCDLTYTIQKTPEGSTGGGGGGGGGGVATYTITAEAGSGGVINPSGEVKVNSGSDYTFTITANKGYEIDDVLVDGESVGAVNRYVFEDVKKSHTIKVSFVRSGEVEEPVVADPDDTGVSGWLITDEHIAYVSGYPDGRFGPNGNMTRAEAAQMFYNLLRDKNVAITVQFTDVADSAWYAKAVNTLASLGIINGVGNDEFAPERSITRAEFTAIAMRFSNGGAAGSNIFTDVSASAWYYDYVIGATGYGWIAGYSDGTFRPDKTITRAEVTTIVNRMLGRSADEAYVDSHRNELMQFTDVDASYWGYYQIMEAANSHDFTKNQNTESWTGLK